jgi:hypothetical protein
MNVNKIKLNNPYNVEFEIDIVIGSHARGVVIIDGARHCLEIISQDIIDCLADIIDSKLINLIPPIHYAAMPYTTNTIPREFREIAVQVKSKLMACKNFQGANGGIFEKYYRTRESENLRHENRLRDLQRDYETRLKKERIEHEKRLKEIEGDFSGEFLTRAE